MADVINLVVEFYGGSRIAAEISEVSLAIPSLNYLTWSDISGKLLEKMPGLRGTVLGTASGELLSSYKINLNGDEFVSQSTAKFYEGDILIIVPSMSGGSR